MRKQRSPPRRGTQALIAQVAPAPGDATRNAELAVSLITSHAEADLAVFPELFLSGYALDGLDEVALGPDAEELRAVARAAAEARTAVIVGFAERIDGGVANSAACIDERGTVVAAYRKNLLFGAEQDAFAPGLELLVVPLAGWNVGVLICFDVEFPELARALARAGADLLATISANMDPYYRHHELHTRARALENGLPHVYVNRVGSEAGFDFAGGSRVVAANGEPHIELPDRGEHVVLTSIPVAIVPAELDYLAQLQATPFVRHVEQLPAPL